MKFLSILLVFAMLLALCACMDPNGHNNPQDSKESENPEVNTEDATHEPDDDTASGRI